MSANPPRLPQPRLCVVGLHRKVNKFLAITNGFAKKISYAPFGLIKALAPLANKFWD